MVIDEALQTHGGAGFIEEYPVERAYRDQRVNRIFEGTNEINRMLITGMLLKRTMKGTLPLFDAATAVDQELTAGNLPKAGTVDELAREALATESMKRLAIYALKVATETFGAEIEQHQETLAAIADVVMDAYAADSMISRTRQYAVQGKLDPVQVAMIRWFVTEAHARTVERARKALCASAKGAELETHLKKIAPLAFFTPYDPAELREIVVRKIEELGGYPVVPA
jgi:alkylation response protein AidB-like acyl-CoA dehydrogenase